MPATGPTAAGNGKRLCASAQCRPGARAFDFKARWFLLGKEPTKFSGGSKPSATLKRSERSNGVDWLKEEAE